MDRVSAIKIYYYYYYYYYYYIHPYTCQFPKETHDYACIHYDVLL